MIQVPPWSRRPGYLPKLTVKLRTSLSHKAHEGQVACQESQPVNPLSSSVIWHILFLHIATQRCLCWEMGGYLKVLSLQSLGYLVKEQEGVCNFPFIFAIYVALEHEETRNAIKNIQISAICILWGQLSSSRQRRQSYNKGNRSSSSGVSVSLGVLWMSPKLCVRLCAYVRIKA